MATQIQKIGILDNGVRAVGGKESPQLPWQKEVLKFPARLTVGRKGGDNIGWEKTTLRY